MKKVIIELFVGDEYNPSIPQETSRLVYWHCSTLPPFKFSRLIAKLGVGFPRFFVAALSHVIKDYFSEAQINLASRENGRKIQLWCCTVVKDSFRKTLQSLSKYPADVTLGAALAQLAFKIEIKIIKYRVMFGFHYPQDFSSEVINRNILKDLDKFLRDLFKSFDM